jgi:uncharacterized protein (TIGR00369 family)
MDYTALAGLVEKAFPFHRMLGIKVAEIREGMVRLYIPFRPELVGHPQILHGGVISSLTDVCGGFAVWTMCGLEDRLATITLSVDYLHPAGPSDLYAEASVRMLGNRVGNAHVALWSEANPGVHVAEGRGVYNIRRGTGT